MAEDQSKDKPVQTPLGPEWQALKNPDASRARVAGAADMAAIEANRSNPSSGSLQSNADLVEALADSVKIVGAGGEASRANQLHERDLNAPLSPYHQVVQDYIRTASTSEALNRDLPNSGESKLTVFGHALIDRAAKEFGDPRKLIFHARELGDKFHGIWDGLNEAKDDVKKLAAEAFSGVAKGCVEYSHDPIGNSKKIALESEKFGEAFANHSQNLIVEMSKDPAFIDRCFKTAVEKCGKDLKDYSRLSSYEQGKIVGKVMFGMINPEGEVGPLAGKAGQLSKSLTGQLHSEIAELGQIGKGQLEKILNEAQQAGAKLAEKIANRPLPAGAHGGTFSPAELGSPVTHGEPMKMVGHKPGGGHSEGGGTGRLGGQGSPDGANAGKTSSEDAGAAVGHQGENKKPLKLTPFIFGAETVGALSKEWLPHSGFVEPVYRKAAGSEKYLSATEVARECGFGTRNDLVSKLSEEQLREKGLERVPVNAVDDVIAGRLESAILGHLKDGPLTKENGLAAADDIREILRPFCSQIDKRNVGFAIVDVDGQRHVIVAVNRGEAVPGTMPTPKSRLLNPDMNPAFPRNSDTEYKILEPVYRMYKDAGEGKISLYSEQDPCASSCHPIINARFGKATGYRIKITTVSEYRDQDERLEGVAARVEKQKNAK